MDLGQYVKTYREDRGFSSRELSRMIGVSSSVISKIENAERSATRETIQKIADALRLNRAEHAVLLKSAGYEVGTNTKELNRLVDQISDELDELRQKIGGIN